MTSSIGQKVLKNSAEGIEHCGGWKKHAEKRKISDRQLSAQDKECRFTEHGEIPCQNINRILASTPL